MDPVREAGATFYLENSTLKEGKKPGVYIGEARLTATVHEIELWEQAIEHLNGLVLHKGRDFKTELIDILQGKHQELEQEIEKERTVALGEVERLRTEAQHAVADLVRAKQVIRGLDARVAQLKERIQEQQRVHNLTKG